MVCASLAAGLSWRLWYQRKRFRELSVENSRWRVLAMERADRIAIVSHEVRTPLALVTAACELLADGAAGPLSEPQQDLVETVSAKSREVLSLAADLLLDARIDADLFSFRTSTVDMRRLTTRTVRDLRSLFPNQITMSTRGALPHIVGDVNLLRQALTNLITNAARHAGADARIAVTVRPSDGGVLIVVSDDGSGMTPEQTRELFRRSLAGKSETGHGLGMLITRRIIELHGGRVFVDSMVDRGTAILCSLPHDGTTEPLTSGALGS